MRFAITSSRIFCFASEHRRNSSNNLSLSHQRSSGTIASMGIPSLGVRRFLTHHALGYGIPFSLFNTSPSFSLRPCRRIAHSHLAKESRSPATRGGRGRGEPVPCARAAHATLRTPKSEGVLHSSFFTLHSFSGAVPTPGENSRAPSRGGSDSGR